MNDTFMKEKPVFPLLLSMALPMVFSMLVNALYNIVDSFFVAQISEDAMTALSLIYPMQNLINAIAIGFGVGINAQIALHLGAGIMGVGTVLCLTLSGPLMGLFTTNPETIAIGRTALEIISCGFLVSAISVASSGALEGLGKGLPSLVIYLFRYCLVIMPLAWLLCRAIGPTGVWHAFWLTEAITAVVALAVYRKSAPKV